MVDKGGGEILYFLLRTMIYFIFSQLGSMEHYMLDSISLPHTYLSIPAMRNTILRRLAHLGWRFGLNMKYNLYGSKFCKQLAYISPNDVVVFFMVENKEPILNMVTHINPKTSKYVWFWNSVNDGLNVPLDKHTMHADVKSMKKVGCKIATFDPFDSDVFDINYIGQFFNFSGITSLNNKIPTYDFYFLGNKRCNSRIDILDEIESEVKKQGKTFNKLLRGVTITNYISYQKNLEHVSNCKCVIEVIRDNQTGLSLRALEALAMKKKLLTTNRNIVGADFYCSDNIFIWGVDDVNRLADFIDTPYKEISESIVSKYDTQNWIKRLLAI